MKILAVVFTILIVASGCASAPKGPSTSAQAVVQRVHGSAEIADRRGYWKAPRPGEKIRAGTSARTGPGSSIDFNLGRAGGFLTLQADSTLTFEQLGPVTKDSDVLAILNLTRGRITGDTLKLPDNTRIIVKTLGGVHEIH